MVGQNPIVVNRSATELRSSVYTQSKVGSYLDLRTVVHEGTFTGVTSTDESLGSCRGTTQVFEKKGRLVEIPGAGVRDV